MSFVTDCDYCGDIRLCENDPHGGTCCTSCWGRVVEDEAPEPEPTNEELAAELAARGIHVTPEMLAEAEWEDSDARWEYESEVGTCY